jgi:hypothetical protein
MGDLSSQGSVFSDTSATAQTHSFPITVACARRVTISRLARGEDEHRHASSGPVALLRVPCIPTVSTGTRGACVMSNGMLDWLLTRRVTVAHNPAGSLELVVPRHSASACSPAHALTSSAHDILRSTGMCNFDQGMRDIWNGQGSARLSGGWSDLPAEFVLLFNNDALGVHARLSTVAIRGEYFPRRAHAGTPECVALSIPCRHCGISTQQSLLSTPMLHKRHTMALKA